MTIDDERRIGGRMLLEHEVGCEEWVSRTTEREIEHTILRSLLGLKGRYKTEEIGKLLVVIWSKALRTKEVCARCAWSEHR